MVHPTAVIHSKAKLHPTVRVGPFAVIDAGVELGADCVVEAHTRITGIAILGARNRIHDGVVIGDEPQDLKYKGAPTRVRIGDDNVFREHVTINRSTNVEGETIIGSSNFLMANCHVGHNCVIGDHVIIANGALLAGHVTVQDRAFISGNCVVHQFTRVGALTMMQGGAGISKDLPPFTIAKGVNTICGLNVVGLRRAGFSVEDRMELKRLYHALFRSGRNIRPALKEAQQLATSAAGRAFLKFISEAKRGVCTDVSRTASAGVEEE